MNTQSAPIALPNTAVIIFWSFTAILCSAISTAVFSEAVWHDNAAMGFMALAAAGLIYSAAQILMNAVLAICNP